MAKKEEAVVEEIQQTETKNEVVKEEGGDMKVTPKAKKATKKKAKQLSQQEPTITKVDLSKKIEEEKQQKEDNVVKVDLDKPLVKEDPVKEEIVEEVKEEQPKEEVVEETPVLQEITDEVVEEEVKEVKEEITEAIEEAKETGEPLPENIQKVVNFMNETGGSLDEYVKLNQDYSTLDENQLLREYYKQTKPHLNDEEIGFIMEDQFSFDEEVDEERDVRRKKLAIKEQVANAKSHLEGLKSKYYAEIKAGVKLTSEQSKAVDFFNRYNTEQKQVQQKVDIFNKKSKEVFNDSFKGFEYNIGEKKFRFNVKDVNKVKTDQNSIGKFIQPFLNEKNEMEKTKDYHKALFTGRNADAVANHFYQQGKADAVKESVAKAKNVSMDPRQQFTGQAEAGGFKVRAISGDNSSKLRVKMNRK